MSHQFTGPDNSRIPEPITWPEWMVAAVIWDVEVGVREAFRSAEVPMWSPENLSFVPKLILPFGGATYQGLPSRGALP